MPQSLISLEDFRKEAREGRTPDAGVFRVQVASPTLVDEASRTVRFVFSDGTVDRVGDTINPNGWETSSYLKNPVILWAHDSWSPPIGRTVDGSLKVDAGKLVGDVEFAAPEVYDFADTIFRLVTAKFVNAGSVGFIPLEWSFVNDKDRPYGIDFKRQELLEYSVCPVPANPNALAEARAAGIDTRPLVKWAEQLLDGEGRLVMPRTEVEQLRRAAAETPSARLISSISKLAARRGPQAKGSPMKNGRGKDGDGMSEGDPAGGGFVATCGRSIDQECGLKNPEECSVHGPSMAESKGALAVFRSALRDVIDEVVREAVKGAVGEPKENLKRAAEHVAAAHKAFGGKKAANQQHEAVTEAHAHVKAADEYLDCYRSVASKAAVAATIVRDPADGDGDGDMDADDYLARAAEHVKAAHGHMKAVDPDGGGDGEAGEHVLAAHAHVKAADEHLESYRSAAKKDADPETAKAERLAVVESLRKK